MLLQSHCTKNILTRKYKPKTNGSIGNYEKVIHCIMYYKNCCLSLLRQSSTAKHYEHIVSASWPSGDSKFCPLYFLGSCWCSWPCWFRWCPWSFGISFKMISFVIFELVVCSHLTFLLLSVFRVLLVHVEIRVRRVRPETEATRDTVVSVAWLEFLDLL